MSSRSGSTPSQFGLTARLAATLAVAAGATLGSVLLSSTPAAAVDQTAPTPGPASPVAAAQAQAQRLLDAFAAPAGAVRLSAAPAAAPAAASRPATTPPYRVAQTGWWRSTQSAAALTSWIADHPEPGFTVAAFALPDGSTVLRVDAVVGYVPARPTSEALPAATRLIVVPTFPLSSKQSAAQVTVTDQNQITEIEQVINSLPKAPAGLVSCPLDDGAGLALVFESSENAPLADVVVSVTGCRHVQISISGYNEPALGDGALAATQIQGILAAHWDLSQTSN